MKRILICGADGFIGAALADALQAAGHRVWRGVRRAPDKYGELYLDYRQLLAPHQWLAVLPDVEVVINCVGIIRETPPVSFALLHEAAPMALFQACTQRGIRRVLQLSALGAEVDAATAYFRSKGRADAALQASSLDWAVVRPSLVPGGDSTRLFRRLASLPLLLLPAGGTMQLQPVALGDVCQLFVRLVEHPGPLRRVIAAVGPQPVTLRDWWRHLRQQQGLGPALELALPLPLMQVAARVAGRWPRALLTPDTLVMLVAGNCAPADDMREWLQRDPASAISAPLDDKARLALLGWRIRLLLRLSLAAVWLGTAAVSFGLYPVQDSLALLAGVGLHGDVALVALYGAASLDLLLGALTLFNPLGPRLWQLQAMLIVVYTAILSLALPQFWLHPFAPLLKNLPILAALAVLGLTEDTAHE